MLLMRATLNTLRVPSRVAGRIGAKLPASPIPPFRGGGSRVVAAVGGLRPDFLDDMVAGPISSFSPRSWSSSFVNCRDRHWPRLFFVYDYSGPGGVL